ncbi:MAG: YjfB family protein [Betaproteobacteria bacterium]|nr:YjfB family protein [Betaproteobacteria bacterium]
MDIGNVESVARAASELSQARTGEAVAVAVLKKAMDIQAQGVAQLIGALPQPANTPPHLGNNVNTFA